MPFTASYKIKLFLVSLITCLTIVTTQDYVIIIPLNKTIAYDDREIYGTFIELNNTSPIRVEFTDINTSLYFILLQVHTQFENITLTNNETNANGTNVGLISILEKNNTNIIVPDTFFIRNSRENISVLTYVSVHGYMKDDPFPGGCNQEMGPPDIYPFLKVRTTEAIITVEASPPSIDPFCNVVNEAVVTFYMMYLSENFNADVYFSDIRKMMSLKSILRYGVELPLLTPSWFMRRLVSAYAGTGVVFVAVSKSYENNSLYSVYVPNHSYGCPDVDENGCKDDDAYFDILCTLLLFIGLFVSFLGHRFFKTEMFLAGIFSGFILTYILVSVMSTNIGTPALVAASVMSGIFFGAIWLLFWWLYGIPIVSVLLPSLNVGFILACIFYYRLSATVPYMVDNFNFWSVFVIITVLVGMGMVFATYSASILSCAFVGGFCVMYSFDYYLDSNLKYIIINTVRRAVVPYFEVTALVPPFMARELLVTLLWIFVTSTGWALQHWHNRGRPPFPPPPRNTRMAAPGPSVYGAVTDFTRRIFVRNPSTGSPILPTRATERTSLLPTTED